MAAAARRARVRVRGGPGVRWDRLGRIGLLLTLGVILLLYVSPTRHWLEQSGTRSAQKQELHQLEGENQRLKRRVRALRDPAALEQAARRLGLVRKGERSYVIENPPSN